MDSYFALLSLSFVENNHMSIFTTFAKQSMINRLSNPINRNRSAAKISKVMSSTLYSPPTILPERLARCLDSWAEPQQVYRLQFRGLAATRAGDGRVMRPCTTQRGARHKSRHTQGLRAHQRSWFRTPKPLISNREHGNSHNKSLNSGLVQR